MDSEILQEKPLEQKRRERVNSLGWALFLIWAGVVFLAENTGALARIQVPTYGAPFGFFHPAAWSLIFLGAGFIVVIEVVIGLLVPGFESSTGGRLVLASILFGIGLSAMFGWEIIWPLLLVAIGLSVLLGAIVRRS